MTVEKKEEKTEPAKTESAKTEPAKTEPVKTEPVKTEGQLDMSEIADLTAKVSAMGKQLTDLSAAVTAIANQGSVNESIKQDNHETDEEEYPTIDIDGINRLLGV